MDREPPRSALPPAERRYRLQQWWLDRSVRAKGLIVVAVPLIALAGTAVARLALQYQERSERAASLASFTLESAASQVLADAVNAETGARGYAATADPLFLAPYHACMIRVGAAHPPIGHLPVHADHATGGALAAGERGGQRMRDI